MSEPSVQQRAAHEPQTAKRTPAWLSGLLVGEATWLLALLGTFVVRAIENYLPAFMNFVVVGFAQSICFLIAFPIGVGGWVFVWGDNGPPYPWLDSWTINVGFAMCLYSVVGVVVGSLGKQISARSRLRTVVLAFAIVAISLGLTVVLLKTL